MSKEIIKSAFINLSIEEQSKIIADLNTIHTDNLEKTVAGGLSQDQKTDIANTLQETPTLESLLPINDSMLAVSGHTLDMTVEGKPIYNHLQIFKDTLIKNYSNNQKFISALPQLPKKIKKLKLHSPAILAQEQDKNIKDRTIITGEQQGNQGGFTNTGVPGMVYLRNEGYTQNAPIKELIAEIQEYGLDYYDACRLVVLILGLPQAGYQDSVGKWRGVGNEGSFAFSAVLGGNVDFLCFNLVAAFLLEDAAGNALPSVS